jgi:hypothetical protein
MVYSSGAQGDIIGNLKRQSARVGVIRFLQKRSLPGSVLMVIKGRFPTRSGHSRIRKADSAVKPEGIRGFI